MVNEHDEYEERVARGVALLDERLPGWRRLITRPIDMAQGDECVLGQVFGYYRRGVEALSGAEDSYNDDASTWAIDHGFLSANEENDDYPPLVAAWRRAEPALTFVFEEEEDDYEENDYDY